MRAWVWSIQAEVLVLLAGAGYAAVRVVKVARKFGAIRKGGKRGQAG